MFINNFDPVALQIFSFEIRWYSLAYIIGISFGWIVGKRFFITNSVLKQTFDDFITYSILAIILGGRLGYVLLYNPKYYFYNFLCLHGLGALDLRVMDNVGMESTAQLVWNWANALLQERDGGRSCCWKVEARENRANGACFEALPDWFNALAA